MKMKKLQFLLFIGLIVSTVSYSNSVIVLEGNYQGKNIYVQNPYQNSSNVGFCVKEVRVNGVVTTDEITSSAFEIDFKAKDQSDSFKLYPDVMKQNKGMEGFSANPSAKHYWFKDIFAYITSFQENNAADTATFRNKEIKTGDTIFYSNGLMILDKVAVNPEEQKLKLEAGEVSLFLNLTIISKEGRKYQANPGIAIKGQSLRFVNDTIRAQSLVLQFNKVIDQAKGKLELGVKESGAITDLITLKVYEFPLINVLWIGVVVMVTGFGMAIRQRLIQKSNLKSV